MAGIYVHIPFCKQACSYCNFHFSTSLQSKDDLIRAICREIETTHAFLENAQVETIYFGGGTPSLVGYDDLSVIMQALSRRFTWSESAEITLEANPDDLTPAVLRDFSALGINRLSIGIQSFDANELVFMRRAHDAEQAKRCVPMAQDAGFHNLSIDLIYGCPVGTQASWQHNVDTACTLNVPHISAYCLTIEARTLLHRWVETKKVYPVEDERIAQQYDYLCRTLATRHFDHYEVSNFTQAGMAAIHNTNYWRSIPYLGFGPSAHSFNDRVRRWNVSNNALYIKHTMAGISTWEEETVDDQNRYNEYILTRMRTKWGCDLGEIKAMGVRFEHHFEQVLRRANWGGWLIDERPIYRLNDRGMFFADRVAEALFYVE